MISHCATFCCVCQCHFSGYLLSFDIGFLKVFHFCFEPRPFVFEFAVGGESRWFPSPRVNKQNNTYEPTVCLWIFAINFSPSSSQGFHKYSQFSVTNIICRIEIIVRTITRSNCMPWIHTQVFINTFLCLGDICFCVYLLRTHSLRHANKAPLNTFRCSQ